MRSRLLAELLGTFILVFAGTGSIVVDRISNGAIGHAGVSLVFGLVVLAMIHAFGEISGAHLNPAVTIAFSLSGRFPWSDVGTYIIAQFSGAAAASLCLRILFPGSSTLGETLPSGSIGQSFVLEIILTAILMLVVLNVSSGAKEKGITAGIAIAAVVAMEAMFAGPVSGASMNPVRSLAPALIHGKTPLPILLLYPVATIVGAALAVPLHRALYANPLPND